MESTTIKENKRLIRQNRKKNKVKESMGERVSKGFAFVIFLVYSITLAFPFLWLIVNSLKTRQEFLADVWALPKHFYIENWWNCLSMEYNGVNLIGMFGNSLFFATCCTAISVYFSSAMAYVLTKYPFRGSRGLYTVQFILGMIPMVGNTAASYKLSMDLHLYDTYIGAIVSSAGGFGTGFILLYGFYKNISWSYAEAAMIDGAGHFSVYFRIMLPMALPGILAVAIQGFIGVWNDYFSFYMYYPSKVTISVGLYALQTQVQYSKATYPELFSAMIVSSIPIFIIYASSQNFIVKNTSMGGIKG